MVAVMPASDTQGGDIVTQSAPRSALEKLLVTASPQLMTSNEIARGIDGTPNKISNTATSVQERNTPHELHGKDVGRSTFTVTYTTSGVAAKSTRVHNAPKPAGITVHSPFAFSKRTADDEQEDTNTIDELRNTRTARTTPIEPSALLFLSPSAQSMKRTYETLRGHRTAGSATTTTTRTLPKQGALKAVEQQQQRSVATVTANKTHRSRTRVEEEEVEVEEPVTSRSLRPEVELATYATTSDIDEEEEEEDDVGEEEALYTKEELQQRVAQAIEAHDATAQAEMAHLQTRCETALHERDELATRLADVVRQCEKMQRTMRRRQSNTAGPHVSFAVSALKDHKEEEEGEEEKDKVTKSDEPTTAAATPIAERDLVEIQRQMRTLAGNMNEMEAALRERNARIAALRQSLATQERTAAEQATQKEQAAALRVHELEAALQRQTEQVRRRMHRFTALESEHRALKEAAALWMDMGQRAAQHEGRVYNALLRLVREMDALGGKLRRVPLPSANTSLPSNAKRTTTAVTRMAEHGDNDDESAIDWNFSMNMYDEEDEDNILHDGKTIIEQEVAAMRMGDTSTAAASLNDLSETQSHTSTSAPTASQSAAQKSALLVRRVLQTRQAGTLRLLPELRRRARLVAQRTCQLAQAALSAIATRTTDADITTPNTATTTTTVSHTAAGRVSSNVQRSQSLARQLERCKAELETCAQRHTETLNEMQAELQRRSELYAALQREHDAYVERTAAELQRMRRTAEDEAKSAAERHAAELAALRQAHEAQRQAFEAQRERLEQRHARLQEQIKSANEEKTTAIQRSAELEKKVAALSVQLQGQRARQLSRSARDSRESTATRDELVQLRRSLELVRMQDAEHQAEATRTQRALKEMRDALQRRCTEAEAAAQEQGRRLVRLTQAAQLSREGELATLYLLLDLLDVSSESAEETNGTASLTPGKARHSETSKTVVKETEEVNTTDEDADDNVSRETHCRNSHILKQDDDDETEEAYLHTTPRLKRLRRKVICAVQKLLRRAVHAEQTAPTINGNEGQTHVPPCLSCPQQTTSAEASRPMAIRVSPSPRQTVLSWPVKASPSPPPPSLGRPSFIESRNGTGIKPHFLCRASSFSHSHSLGGLSPSHAPPRGLVHGGDDTYYGKAGDLDGSGRPAPPPLLRCMSASH